MGKVVIYPSQAVTGQIILVRPTADHPETDLQRGDVPAGLPFLFVDESDVPADPDYMEAWEADFSNPDGTGIGLAAWEAKQLRAQAVIVTASIAATQAAVDQNVAQIQSVIDNLPEGEDDEDEAALAAARTELQSRIEAVKQAFAPQLEQLNTALQTINGRLGQLEA